MIEMYKIFAGKYDTAVMPGVNREGTILGLQKKTRVRPTYDLRKYYFTNRALNIWNSLLNHVVLSDTVNMFKSIA